MSMANSNMDMSLGLRCCCGSANCALLHHNTRLLDGLERQVSKAAQLGQALLVRHEESVADSERERKHMIATIDRLEQDNLELEASNSHSIKANCDLRDQLEHLNHALTHSDAHVQALTDTLRSTEKELERLSLLAARTQLLEKQLIDLEYEQSQLQANLDAKLVDERTAIQRWKAAENTIVDLQDQIDRIEKEARQERERHVQVVARMERRMAAEGELSTASGKLKARTAHDKAGTNVVSHFVKDILLDNANFQHAISELREMLVSSNEEVERLREQLKIHQPVPSSPVDDLLAPTLQKELEMESEPAVNQEVHIHHHYHGAKPSRKLCKLPAHQRLKKKRSGLTPSHFDPPPLLDRSSVSTILDHTAVSVPHSHRWSQASTLLAGSYPASPMTESQGGSVYDRVFSDAAYDSSRPTSPPDSIDLQSPMLGPTKDNVLGFDQDITSRRRRKKSHGLRSSSLSAVHDLSASIPIRTKSSPVQAVISAVSPTNSHFHERVVFSSASRSRLASIPSEENENGPLSSDSVPCPEEAEAKVCLASPPRKAPRLLRRQTSHESLISVSGMDIHTLQSRPSQLLYSPSLRFTKPRGAGSIEPELTPWTATAHGMLSRDKLNVSALTRSLLDTSMANQKQGVGESGGPGLANTGLGKRMGDWVFSRWSATAPVETSRPALPCLQPAQSLPRQSMAADLTKKNSSKKKKRDEMAKPRPSGVNQLGPILGIFDVPEVPTKVVVEEYDAAALNEALSDLAV